MAVIRLRSRCGRARFLFEVMLCSLHLMPYPRCLASGKIPGRRSGFKVWRTALGAALVLSCLRLQAKPFHRNPNPDPWAVILMPSLGSRPDAIPKVPGVRKDSRKTIGFQSLGALRIVQRQYCAVCDCKLKSSRRNPNPDPWAVTRMPYPRCLASGKIPGRRSGFKFWRATHCAASVLS